jgi:MoaA/NifB/PqqE/SkfB family radical SAM enzyme
MKNPVASLKKIVFYEHARMRQVLTGRMLPPFCVAIELNYDCPSRCRTCHLWTRHFREVRVDGREKMSFEQWRCLLDDCAQGGVKSILFGGGEPFLSADIFRLIREITARGMSGHTFTNGYLIDRQRAEEIVTSGLKSLAFSIDGSTAQIHDAIRNVPGAFEKATAAIALVQEFKKRLGSDTPHISINTTISSCNFDDVVRMPDLAKSLQVDEVSFMLFSIVDERSMAATNAALGEQAVTCHSFSNLPGDLLLTDAQFDRLYTVLDSLRATAPSGVSCTVDPMLYKTGRDLLRKGYFAQTRCNYFWNMSVISPFGDVIPCPMLPEIVLGNVKESRFWEIWDGDRYFALRKKFRKGLFPICGKCCTR